MAVAVVIVIGVVAVCRVPRGCCGGCFVTVANAEEGVAISCRFNA